MFGFGVQPLVWDAIRKYSCVVCPVSPVGVRVHQEVKAYPVALHDTGCLQGRPCAHQGVCSARRHTPLELKLTVHDADLGSHVVIVGVELRYLEVLIVIGGVQQVGCLCGCMTLLVNGISVSSHPGMSRSRDAQSSERPKFVNRGASE